jgi:fatty-acyl-CoA synthase
MSEWTIGAVLDAIADVAPDRVMTVCGDRRSTFGQGAERTRRLANFLAGAGLGAHRERENLQNWECGQDRVALIMHNDLYPDMMIGCLKARTVPVNINYNYTPGEVHELLEYLQPRAMIYHKSLGAKFSGVLPPHSAQLLISVDDGSPVPKLPDAVVLDDALARGDTDQQVTPSPDDVLMVCTGGTTGRPKAMLWRQSDIYVSSMAGADHDSVHEIHDKVRGTAGASWFAVSPLMHAAGVGDAYAAPLVAELQRGRYHLSSLFAIGTGGAATNLKHQRALLELLPQITLINGYGSSETGNMGFGHSRSDTHSDTFTLREGGLIVSEDYRRFLGPGEGGIGWVARHGRIPLGYFNDPAATGTTFPEVDGERVVISGDRAGLEEDGTLRLFGRDSLVVNTGGEKVFVEEVEEVLRAHPAVADALVVGRPSEHWGEELVALVELCDGADALDEPLHTQCTSQLARFKAPKQFLFVERVHRLGNGKPDYRWAKVQATQGMT